MNILQPNLTGVIASIISKNSPTLVQISGEMVTPQSGNGVMTFFCRLFSLFSVSSASPQVATVWSELHA